MSYCKAIDIVDVFRMSEEEINKTLDKCECDCCRYSLCDTVAIMEDKLKAINEND